MAGRRERRGPVMFRALAAPAALSLAVALLASSSACSGGGGGGDGSPPPPAGVEESLAAFGVDTAQTPRAGDDQEALPESYTPFGTARTFDRTDELAVIGVRLSPASFG